MDMGLFSRRNMLLGGAAAAGAATVGTSNGAGFLAQVVRPAGPGSNAALPAADYGDWLAQVGSNFTAHTGQVLKLVDVQKFPTKGARPDNVREGAFVARFDIARGGSLPEDLYRVAHPRGGTFEMFLTNGSPDKPLRMLAVFN